MLIQLLEKLINKKYYEKKEEIENKLNVFYAMSKISDEQYSNLILKIEEVYIEEIPEVNEIEETVIEDETESEEA